MDEPDVIDLSSTQAILDFGVGGFSGLLRRAIKNLPEKERTYDGVSSVGSMCQTLELLNHVYGRSPPLFDTHRKKFSTIQGTLLHALFQSYGPLDSWLVGYWKCPRCDSVTEKLGKKPSTLCPCRPGKDRKVRRGEITYEYEEIALRIPNSELRGHTDGILDLLGESVLLDIKTIDSKYFKKLKEVKLGYVIQTQLYMLFWNHESNKKRQLELEKLGMPGKVTKAIVLYVSPGDKEWVDFELPYDEPFAIQYLEHAAKVLETRRRLSKTLRLGTVEKLCESKYDDSAFFCPKKDQCFDHKKLHGALTKARKDAEKNRKKANQLESD